MIWIPQILPFLEQMYVNNDGINDGI
jgi:hypothetical protein